MIAVVLDGESSPSQYLLAVAVLAPSAAILISWILVRIRSKFVVAAYACAASSAAIVAGAAFAPGVDRPYHPTAFNLALVAAAIMPAVMTALFYRAYRTSKNKFNSRM